MKEISEGDLFTVNVKCGEHKDDQRKYKLHLFSLGSAIVELIEPSQYQIDSDQSFSSGRWKDNSKFEVE